ncbi:hypothetical protein O181_040490 [Austropuccinia psidii MF-1]|uniref:Serine aminopeptidase S33 domain-containing protein n=1 Tax=Austropuccinia psidii MF-1 TaxID=1389203 RepID=A0A9Q3DD95_9BASI|nr:hypothetical protein [Austropuccinia psidii MF-1]
MATIVGHRCVLSDGVTIALFLRRHPKPALPGLVVLLHGRLHNSKKGPCAELFTKLPYSALIFDARGMGESGGSSGWSNIEEEVNDLKEIIKYVKENFEAPHNQILALIGHSKGASIGFQYASQVTFCKDLAQPMLYDERYRPALLVSLSGRYDTTDTGLSRFTFEQQAQLEKEGRFVWLRYRAGPDREERREYVVTKEAVEQAKHRTLECVKDLGDNCQVLLLHGRADGTVLCKEAEKIDQAIRDNNSSASVDLLMIEGVKHNWDQEGEIELASHCIEGWIQRRAGRDSTRIPEEKIVDHLGPHREKQGSA